MEVSHHERKRLGASDYLTLNCANALASDDPALAPEFVAAALNSSPLAFAHHARCSLPRLLRRHLEWLPLPRAERVHITRTVWRPDCEESWQPS